MPMNMTIFRLVSFRLAFFRARFFVWIFFFVCLSCTFFVHVKFRLAFFPVHVFLPFFVCTFFSGFSYVFPTLKVLRSVVGNIASGETRVGTEPL